MSMSYFPPKGFEDCFNGEISGKSKKFRLGSYRGWFLSITCDGTEDFTASVWTFGSRSKYPIDNVEKSYCQSNFKTEEEAAQWCKDKVDSRFKTKLIQESYCIDFPDSLDFKEQKFVDNLDGIIEALTPSNEELLKLAEKYKPPQSWYEEESES